MIISRRQAVGQKTDWLGEKGEGNKIDKRSVSHPCATDDEAG